MTKIKLLIIEPDAGWRDIFKQFFSTVGDMEIVSISLNGEAGLGVVNVKEPDVILFCDPLPDTTSVVFTRKALALSPRTGIILLPLNQDNYCINSAVEALTIGAVDLLLKPEEKDIQKQLSFLERILLPRIRMFSIRRYSQIAKNIKPSDVSRLQHEEKILSLEVQKVKRLNQQKLLKQSLHRTPYEAVIMGISTGGPEALFKILPVFPSAFIIPIIIVLHIPKQFSKALADSLNKKTSLRVKEAEDGEIVNKGTIYLAPGGIHLTVSKNNLGRIVLSTVDSPPENGCKPSVDVLFQSAAPVFKEKVVSIIMTGMGCDGLKGVEALKAHNVHVLVQDEATSVVWGMPQAIIKAGYADEILPLEKIPKRLIQIMEKNTYV